MVEIYGAIKSMRIFNFDEFFDFFLHIFVGLSWNYRTMLKDIKSERLLSIHCILFEIKKTLYYSWN